jgi:hypothetical protein
MYISLNPPTIPATDKETSGWEAQDRSNVSLQEESLLT